MSAGSSGTQPRSAKRIGAWVRGVFLAVVACFVSRTFSMWLARQMVPPPDTSGVRQLRITASGTPATPTDLLWEERAEQLRFDALPNIRKTAEKWAGSIGAATGVFGIVSLIKGRDAISGLTPHVETAVGILSLVALLLALRAIVLAALAAQGSPRLIRYTGARIRTAYLEEARLAMDLLKYSRVLTVAAVLVFATAIGLTWYGPTKQKTDVEGPEILVVMDSGSVVCGVLKGGINGSFTIERAGKRIPVEVAKISSLDPVPSCT
jgi:hypothetical protein